MNPAGHPQIANITLQVVQEKDEEHPSIRFQAPEVLNGSAPTRKSDVYSFGMTVLELMSHLPPYSDIMQDSKVLEVIMEGKEPSRSKDAIRRGLSDPAWERLRLCWRMEESRPLAHQLPDSFMT